MEVVFRAERLDAIFAKHAKVQYQRDLLFSSLVNLLSLVVCGRLYRCLYWRSGLLWHGSRLNIELATEAIAIGRA